jgi:hypothetical protein
MTGSGEHDAFRVNSWRAPAGNGEWRFSALFYARRPRASGAQKFYSGGSVRASEAVLYIDDRRKI